MICKREASAKKSERKGKRANNSDLLQCVPGQKERERKRANKRNKAARGGKGSKRSAVRVQREHERKRANKRYKVPAGAASLHANKMPREEEGASEQTNTTQTDVGEVWG